MDSIKRAQWGLTLVELMVTVTLVAILLAIALPSYRSMVNTNRMSSGVNAFAHSLQLARSEAAKRGQRVTQCVSDDGVSCSRAGGWHRGWIVFHDPDGNAQRNNDEALIWVQPALQEFSIVGNQPVARYVSYTEHGWPRLTTGALQMGTFSFCLAEGSGRSLVLSSVGRVRSSDIPCESS